MVVEKFDVHPYKVIISRDWRELNDLLKSCMTDKYYYRFTIYFGPTKIFSMGYINSKEECKNRALEYLESITEKM